jgi:hypothetical protein
MSKTWIRDKAQDFARDVFRDFCIASRELEREFRRFDRTGHVDFAVIRDLLGLEMNKGLMWRVKDTAHHLFREFRGGPVSGRFLDWGIGYVFHELMKLKEDAYQEQTYAPAFEYMAETEMPEEMREISAELAPVLEQTHESITREITRIRFILRYCRRIFPIYLASHSDNHLLARFIYKENELVREIFGDRYQEFIRQVYGEKPEKIYLLAARSLREGGWYQEAEGAMQAAEKLGPEKDSVLLERENLNNSRV